LALDRTGRILAIGLLGALAAALALQAAAVFAATATQSLSDSVTISDSVVASLQGPTSIPEFGSAFSLVVAATFGLLLLLRQRSGLTKALKSS